MVQAREYERQKDGMRLDFRGINTVLPVDKLPEGKYPYAQNVRRYQRLALTGRAMQNAALFPLAAASVNTMRRLNDTTPAGPVAGFIIVSSAGADLYANGAVVNSSLSGQRVSMVPFRPNASVQPWMYVADEDVMLKVRSDGTTYKQGIKEPQVPAMAMLSGFPQDGLINPFEVLAQWTAINGATSLGVRTAPTAITAILYDFGTTGQASVIWPGTTSPNDTLFLNGNLNNGVFVAAAFAAPGNTTVGSIAYDSGSTGFAWITLASPLTVTVNQVYHIGGAGSEYVRIQAVQDNAGQTLIRVFTVNTHAAGATLTGTASYRMLFLSAAVAGNTLSDGYIDLTVSGAGTPVQLQGNVVTTFYMHQHVFNGQCELRNPVDGGNNPGSGSYPQLATATGNSVLFNPPQLTGSPDPNSQPMQQAVLDDAGNITGYTTPYAGATQNYNMVALFTLVFPDAGNHSIQIDHDDGMYFGANGGIGLVSGPTVQPAPTSTLTALNGYPYLGGNNVPEYNTDTYVISIPAGGAYDFEIDFCQYENNQALNVYVDGVTPSPGTATPEYGMYTFSPAVDQLIGNREAQPSDLVHLILQTNLPSAIEDITVTFNVDPNVQDFVTNAFQWTIPDSQLTSANTWLDINTPIQALTRIGQGVVSGITVNAGGTGYTQSTTTVSFAGGGGSGAAAVATVDNATGEVTGITVTNEGTGYAFAPTVVITSTSGGTGASATASLSGVNLALSMGTGIFGVQIVVTKTSGTVSVLFDNLIIVGQFGPTVLASENADLWYYTYFSSATGAESNPSPAMRSGLAPGGQGVVLMGEPSLDPQVNLKNWYRQGGAIANPVFVGNSPNSEEPFLDDLDDTTVEDNPQLQFDNFEPFPSIDLPQQGVCSTNGFEITWVSGDKFNTRWLGGTLIQINGISYDLYNRPSSTTQLEVLQSAGIQDNVPFQIQQPSLAAQAMAAMWGPTDNVAFNFACRDPLRPGTLYFTQGNNPDAAPDTNQIEVCSSSEILMNGCIVNGLSLVMSTERGYTAYPNFFSALATVTGTQGSPFTMVGTITDRGLFAPDGICSDGANAYFIGKDGIYKAPGGQGSQSITDEDIYNLFPHETSPGVFSVPLPIQLAGYILFPPDFSNPNAMALAFATGYVYFDYEDVNGNRRTLVYDAVNGGWCPDVYQFPVVSHVQAEGDIAGIYVGCTDGSIRQLVGEGTENSQAVILLPAFNADDARAQKRFGDIFISALVPTGETLTVLPYANQYENAIAGTVPTSLPSVGAARAPYIVDFNDGDGVYAVDIEGAISWTLNTKTILYLWQPSLVPQPEGVQNRPGDWDDAGEPGAKFVQGLILEADTFGKPKEFKIQIGDDLSLYAPNEVPVIFNGQSIKPFSVTPPIVGAHNMRLHSIDGVQWRVWQVKWIFEPLPEAVIEWQTEMVSFGVTGWFHTREVNIPAIATAAMLLTVVQDHWPTYSVIIPSTNGLFVKQKVTLPATKSKLTSFRLSSTESLRPFKKDVEVKLRQWGSDGPYQIVKPFGGLSNEGALV